MKRLIVESPFKATETYSVEENIAFARKVCRHALLLGYSPYASHLFFTQPGLLDDDLPNERRLGIDAGLVWSVGVGDVWFALRSDEKLSVGMTYAANRHRMREAKVQFRIYSPEGEFLRFTTEAEVWP